MQPVRKGLKREHDKNCVPGKSMTRKTTSLSLAMLMLAGTAAPAYAANADSVQHIEVYYNDAGYPAQRYQVDSGKPVQNMKLYEQGTSQLSKITVQSGSYSHEQEFTGNSLSGTLPNGTTYQMKLSNSGGSDALYLTTSNLVDDLQIHLWTDAAEYTVVGNSGTLGSNSNYGSDSAPTCSVTGSGSTVAGGESTNMVFTPNAGLQIKKLNIRTGYSNQSNLVDAVTGSVTVGGQTYQITKQADGSVSVSCAAVAGDLFITALTANAATMYDLNVVTDANITASVTNTSISSDEKTTVTFTPDSRYSIYKFIIESGGTRKTLYVADSSVTVGNKTYRINKNLNGQIVMEIPPASADVSIEAVSTYGSYSISVLDRAHVSSNYDSITTVGYGEDATVVLTPLNHYDITSVRISMGDYSTRVSTNETSFRLNGKTYRMEKNADGVVYLYLKDIESNVQIDPSAKDSSLKLTVTTDKGVTCNDKGTVTVLNGDVQQLTFVPVDRYTIQEIKVVRAGKTYTAQRGDSYLTVNGVRCPINWTASGRAIITLYDITESMTVSASSNYQEGNRYITKKPDTHSTITHDAANSNYAKPGEAVTVTVKPKTNYQLATVKVSTNTDAATIYHNTTRFMLNGNTYYVTHQNDGTWKINFASLPASVTVTSTAVDRSSTLPDAPNNPIQNQDGYHNAYITGVGNGKFDPDRNMTRAEAVAMLTRLYYNVDEQYMNGYHSNYYDAVTGAWYNGYLGWAQDQGLLDANGYFRPNDYITRAEFVDLLCRFQDVNTFSYNGYSLPYSDMRYYYQANPTSASQIAYATGKGWITGYPDGTFQPNSLIRRSEVVAMTNRAANRKPDKQTIFNNMHLLTHFSDVPVSHWAFYDIMEACNPHEVYRTNFAAEQWGR